MLLNSALQNGMMQKKKKKTSWNWNIRDPRA